MEPLPLDRERGRLYSRLTGEKPDLAAVVAIMQAVSSEIDLEKLVGTLMVTALEYAGGNRCFLLLKHGTTWIEAEAKGIAEGMRVDLRRTRALRVDLPEDILKYVVSTPTGLTLDETTSPPLSDDDHIEMFRSRSVLCLPMIKQDRLVGLLYFENRLPAAHLTPARLAVLRILASQAAKAAAPTIKFLNRCSAFGKFTMWPAQDKTTIDDQHLQAALLRIQ